MLQFTTIARAADGLILAADTETSTSDLERSKATAKNLLKKLSSNAAAQPVAMAVEAAAATYYILNEGGVFFLTMCDPSSPAVATIAYLEDVAQEFLDAHGQQVDAAKRPYSFIKFDLALPRIKKRHVAAPYGRTPTARNGGDITRRTFRDVMGYGDAPKKSAQTSGGTSDTTVAIIAGGVAFAVLVVVVVLVMYLSD